MTKKIKLLEEEIKKLKEIIDLQKQLVKPTVNEEETKSINKEEKRTINMLSIRRRVI